MTLTLKHFDEEDEAFLRKHIDDLLRLERTHGGIKDARYDVRQTGFTLHVKTRDRADVYEVAKEAQVHLRSPDLVTVLISKLLDLPEDYQPSPSST
jgi:hypothetical protein